MESLVVDEVELLERTAGQDPKAFAHLVHAHQGPLRSFLAARLWDSSETDDVAQEVFVIAFDRIGTFETGMPFFPWLKGIALNLLRNRSRKRRPEPLDQFLDHSAAEEAEKFDNGEVFDALDGCLEELESSAARIIRKRYTDRTPLSLIADQEGKTEKAVSVALVRIRRTLRDCIGRKTGEIS